LWHLDLLLKESVDWKNEHIDIVSLHEDEEEEPNGRFIYFTTKEERQACTRYCPEYKNNY